MKLKMPTIDADTRTHNFLPDIFRTITGLNLNLGPYDRFRSGESNGSGEMVWRNVANESSKRFSTFPRIILRDVLGHELDTFTTLQTAIYRAKANIKMTGQACTPLEWRLPKAPPPARPDLTRTCPPPKHPPASVAKPELKNSWDYSRVLVINVDDVGFVRESLQHLPFVQSLSFLQQDILVGPKTYIQIVGTMLLHKRFLSQTEKRQVIYNFPGFCTGCVRMGLCYGCEKGTELHFHKDKLVKTGGGFTYYKKDRPQHEIESRKPINWKIQHPNRVLKKLFEEYTGVNMDGEVPEVIRQHLDEQIGHYEPSVSDIPEFSTNMKAYYDKDSRERSQDIFMPESTLKDTENEYDTATESQYQGRKLKRHKHKNMDTGDIDQDDEDEEREEYDETESNFGEQGYVSGNEMEQQVDGVNGIFRAGFDDDESRQAQHYSRYEHRLPKYKEESGTEAAGTTDNEDSKRGRRHERLYRAPPPFKLKKLPKKTTRPRSPFSTERSYDLPKGNGLNITKSDKRPTQFQEFGRHDGSWQKPKKFELKKADTKTTKFWSGPHPKKSGHAKRSSVDSNFGKDEFQRISPVPASPDSGLDREFLTDSNKSNLESIKGKTSPDIKTMERNVTPLHLQVSTSSGKPATTQPTKRDIVKKERKPITPLPPREPTPVASVKSSTPTSQPYEEDKPLSREITFDYAREASAPKLPSIEIPDLPEFVDKKSEYKGVKRDRKLIEVTPELPEQKKKLPPPPKLGPKIKPRVHSRKTKVAEAPVTTQELQQLSDPLDFLAKYCIINPERLPFYEKVFNVAVNVQTPRYSHDFEPRAIVSLPPAKLSEHELNMLKDLTVITHAQIPRREGMSVPEQYLEKLNYSIDFIKMKQDFIQDHMHQLQTEKIHLMAALAKEIDRDIVRVNYKTKAKKKKKKKKKSADFDIDSVATSKNFQPMKASDITDEVIVSRMDDKMLKRVKKNVIVKKLTMEISRDIEKLKHYDMRIAQVEDEKDLVGLYCMDSYFNEQNSSPPYEFRRQQSRLYQKLHPDPDIEMNIEEVEAALQQVNNRLLSQKEFQYIYFILDLPNREKINFRLFSIIAALSEKVTQLDPVIRKLLNKVDYNALDVKMEKSKALFELLQDESVLPVGNAPADVLAVELTAGGLTPEHTNYVLSKFNRQGKGFIDFLDFVTYVPLFIDIHKRIIEDPFNDAQDI